MHQHLDQINTISDILTTTLVGDKNDNLLLSLLEFIMISNGSVMSQRQRGPGRQGHIAAQDLCSKVVWASLGILNTP